MCMIDGADYTWDFYTQKTPTARKAHRCYECGRTIEAREVYDLLTAKGPEGIERYKTCAHCLVARNWLFAECGGYLAGGVGEDIDEHVSEGYGFGVARLSVGMRRQWQRFTGAGLLPVPKMPKVSEA
jgi:hypothetical protein